MGAHHLNGLLIVAILLISTAPLYAQRQQQNVAKLKADARNLVGIIGSDKTRCCREQFAERLRLLCSTLIGFHELAQAFHALAINVRKHANRASRRGDIRS
jgi:hypothetical protein